MKRIYFMILGLLIASMAFGNSTSEFKELIDPRTITIDNGQIFITDGVNVHIYSLKDYKLQHSFGKSGEGPREFKVHPDAATKIIISVRPKFILVDCLFKVLYFKRDGTFIKESKVSSGLRYQPIGDQFVANSRIITDKFRYFAVNLYDSKFNKIKELYREKGWFQVTGDFDPVDVRTAYPLITGDTIVVPGKKVLLFNNKGEKIHTIDYQFDKIKITDADKQKYIDWYENSKRLQRYYQFLKPRMKFAPFYPDIKDCAVDNNTIYVLTFKKKDSKSEFVVFDLNGKFLNKAMVDFADIDVRDFYPYTIKNNKLYQLIFDEDEETWSLNVVNII